jgi:hypothetical protein
LLFCPDENGTGGWFTMLVESLQKDLSELAELERAASAERKHNVAGMLHRAQRTLSERRVLDRFAQGGVLPKYGFPVDVVELDLSRSQAGNDLDLNRDLRLGILEFAPGAKVVAANKLWKSVGIKLMPGRDLPLMHWGICEGCECLRTAFAAGDSDDGLRGPCQFCGSENFKAGRRGKFIAPQFGFVGSIDDEKPGETRPPREGHLETYFADFEGPQPPNELVELGGVPFGVRLSRRGWITVFNRGRSGRGFWYCSWCGHAQDTPPTRTKRKPDGTGHKRPNSETDCNGRLWQVDLGHRFLTNVVELDLPLDGSWPARVAANSAMQALLSAVPAIGITQSDLGGSLAVGNKGQVVEVLFDDVPGGAGHSRYLHAHLGDLIRAAVDRMAVCSCGAETSCYGCLRSYRNQAHHDELIRHAALDVLRKVLD